MFPQLLADFNGLFRQVNFVIEAEDFDHDDRSAHASLSPTRLIKMSRFRLTDQHLSASL